MKKEKVDTSSSSESEICGAGKTSLLLFFEDSAFSILEKKQHFMYSHKLSNFNQIQMVAQKENSKNYSLHRTQL